MAGTFEDIYELIATQKAIIEKQDKIINNLLREKLCGDVAPKLSHWRVISKGYGDNACICECAKCKDTVWVYLNADRKWKYCPNCGAKMVEAKELNS
jgi:NADH pyrophosphatase NudC (nudix superfamily)